MAVKSAILIPARIGSTRFPEKPLAILNGMPMVRRVYFNCLETGLDTFVLTDSKRVASLFPNGVALHEHWPYVNGTERCAGALDLPVLDHYERFINVQCDMPDVTATMIEHCLECLNHYPLSTVYTSNPKDDSVKLIRAGDQALWFSRNTTGYGEWHLGLYGYRRDALQMYNKLEIPSEEDIEKLEQLRWLKNGWQMGCSSVQFNGIEINTPDDIKTWQNNIQEKDPDG